MKRPSHLLATLGLSAVVATGLGFGTASLASAHPAPSPHPVVSTTYETTSHGLIINVTNSSTHNLRWIGDLNMSPSNTPKPILHPGQTDRLVYKGSGGRVSARPQYQIDESEYSVYPVFVVPLVGPNAYGCTVNDMSSYQSPVGMSHCDIGSGWEPDAHVTFGNRTPR